VVLGWACWLFAGLAGVPLAGAFWAQTSATGNKNSMAAANLGPKVGNVISLVIM
jgi:phage terminase large subunit-like protein